MRILTTSPLASKGLISIREATDNAWQNVIFCIPIDAYDAYSIRDIFDFGQFFSRGITAKIKAGNTIDTVHLNYEFSGETEPEIIKTSKLITNINGLAVEFFISPLNFSHQDPYKFDISFKYTGTLFLKELKNEKLLILEPDLSQLDKLFLKEGITFTD